MHIPITEEGGLEKLDLSDRWCDTLRKLPPKTGELRRVLKAGVS